MQVSQVKLKRDTERELFFAHYPLSGWVFAALGAGFGYSPTYFGADPVTRWIFGGIGVLFGLIGIVGAFWRYELFLDLTSRSYTCRRGFWPSPKRFTGFLEELTAVILTQEWSRSHSSNGRTTEHPWWKISLEFKGWEKPVSIEAVRSERKAHERLEYYAKRLRTAGVDRTGASEVRRNWQELNLPIAERKPAEPPSSPDVVTPSLPPQESGITITSYPGQMSVTLPVVGFNAGLVVMALFGFAFAGFGGFFMLAKSGLYTELTGQAIKVQESSPQAGWIIASVFVLIGFAVSLIGFIGSYGRQQVREAGQDLVYGFQFFGRSIRQKRVAKREIEEVDLRGDISARSAHQGSVRIGSYRIGTNRRSRKPRTSEVFIRSDKAVIRLGSHLKEPHKKWLAAVVRQWAGGRR